MRAFEANAGGGVVLWLLTIFAMSCGDEPNSGPDVGASGEPQSTKAAALSLQSRDPVIDSRGRFAHWDCTEAGCANSTIPFEIFQGDQPPAHTAGPEPDFRDSTIAPRSHREWLDSRDAGQQETVVIELVNSTTETDPEFARRLAKRPAAQRVAVTDARRDAFLPSQADLRNFIERAGGTVHGSFWSSNAVEASLPGDLLKTVEARTDVMGVFRTDVELVSDYDMNEVANEILVDAYHNDSLKGEGATSNSGDNITLCIVDRYRPDEPGWGINSGHAAFLDYTGGQDRVIAQEYCDSGTNCVLSINTGNWSHQSGAAALAAASIREGQDTSFSGTDTTDQKRRSGIAIEASLYGMIAEMGDQASYRRAVERCVEVDPDVIVAPSSIGGAHCDPTQNPQGIRSAVNAALDADIVYVTSTSNNGDLTPCNVRLPAPYPGVVGVGYVDSSTSTSYGGEPVGSGNPAATRGNDSSFGHANATGYNGVPVLVPAVTVVGPAGPDLWATNGTVSSGNSAYASGSYGQTSASSAIVGGAAGLIVEMLRRDYFEPNYLEVNTLIGLMGDGATSATTKARTYVDDEYGYGRFKMQLPMASANGPGTIEASKFSVGTTILDAGQYSFIYMPDCIWDTTCTDGYTGIKAAAFIEDPGKDSQWLPNVELDIVDYCNNSAVIKSASSANYGWKRIRVFDTWRFAGTCPMARVTLNDNAYYQDVRIGVAIYMFGPGNPDWEWH